MSAQAPAKAAGIGNEDPEAPPVVEFVDVQKTYDGRTLVITDLNLEVGEHEFLTMLGPSGSGKTTCLMMLAGFEPTSGGEIRLKGQPVNRMPPYKRNIGMVFQSYALFPHMTVGDNIGYPLKVRGVSKKDRDRRVEEALNVVQLEGFASRHTSMLSGGQQQRVALARALVFEPTLVLMDEPLGALDRQLREYMQLELQALQKRLGITVVYVTHDQGEALTMSDRIAVFNEGVVQQCASPEEIYNRPQNAFVAQFIGENNTLTGRVRDIDNDGFCTVETDTGLLIRCVAVSIERAGEPTSLSLRPEHILLERDSGQVENSFEARVSNIVFMGDYFRTELDMGADRNFVVKVPNNSDVRPPAIGDQVRIGWRAEDCRALDFPADDSA